MEHRRFNFTSSSLKFKMGCLNGSIKLNLFYSQQINEHSLATLEAIQRRAVRLIDDSTSPTPSTRWPTVEMSLRFPFFMRPLTIDFLQMWPE